MKDHYEQRPEPARRRQRRPNPAGRFLEGFTLGFLAWTGLLRLGIPNTLGLGSPAVMLIFAVLLALLSLSRRRRYAWYAAGITTFLVLVVGYTPMMPRLMKSLVLTAPPQKADAIVVLSSSTNAEGRMSLEALDRLIQGASLYREGYAPAIVLTELDDFYPEPKKDLDTVFGLLPNRPYIVSVGPVHSTADEAKLVRKAAEERNWNKILLVTSPTHSKRAARIFEKQKLEVISVPCPERKFTMSSMKKPVERWDAFHRYFYEKLAWFTGKVKRQL